MNDFKTKLICVKGNCDGEVDQMVLDFPILATYNNILLKDRRVFMTHGHTYTPSSPQALNPNDCFLSGHTHVPTAYQENGIYLLNPGSISLPKENHPRTYAILTDTDYRLILLSTSCRLCRKSDYWWLIRSKTRNVWFYQIRKYWKPSFQYHLLSVYFFVGFRSNWSFSRYLFGNVRKTRSCNTLFKNLY